MLKKNFYIFVILIFFSNYCLADNTYFIDFSKVLNQSTAGAKAQENLKKKFEDESKKFKKEEEKLKEQEKDLISQKKTITSDEYKKKVEDLRKKVSELQKRQQVSLNSIAQFRAKAKQELLKAVNPIIKAYMEQNNIRIVIDKQSVVLGDTTLEITDKIIDILNKELKSINVN